MTMPILRALLISVLLIAFPASAQATTVIEPPGSHFPYQRWTDEAQVPTPPGVIKVVETSAAHGCPSRKANYPACTNTAGTIWAAPAAVADPPRETWYHELGHEVDAHLLAPWMRERFMSLFGLEGPWQVDAEPQPYTPAERFADVYADCAERALVSFPPRLGFGPIFRRDPLGGYERHNQICRMLRRL